MLQRLWRDDAGAIIATEYVFLVSILVLGLVTGFKSLQSAVLNEFEELAGAIGALSQTYSIGGTSGCCSSTGGSKFTDTTNTFAIDTCTDPSDAAGPSCPE